LSNLLLSFITNGSDIVDLFGYIDEMDINLSTSLSISILGGKNRLFKFISNLIIFRSIVFFSISVFQFSFTLSAKIETNFRRHRNLPEKIYDYVFGTEIWALCIVLCSQDFPFFIIRLLILIYNPSIQSNYTLYFFVVKSFVLIVFEIYYMISIIIEIEENKDNDFVNFDDIVMTKF